jgi:hypothetical protein
MVFIEFVWMHMSYLQGDLAISAWKIKALLQEEK